MSKTLKLRPLGPTEVQPGRPASPCVAANTSTEEAQHTDMYWICRDMSGFCKSVFATFERKKSKKNDEVTLLVGVVSSGHSGHVSNS